MWGDLQRPGCVSVCREFEDIEQAKIDIMLEWTDRDIECLKVRFDCITYFKI